MKKKGCFYLIFIMMTTLISPIQAKVCGFQEISKHRYGTDTMRQYKHEQSGIEVVWIQNKDINKCFVLGVKTPSTNNTGVNHILEHTLFTGSKEYLSSSLFFDAAEAYPSTYMNALTTGDMTIFPFCTPYDVCYKALLNIYLDAIFKPDLINQPYGFYEEGYHKVPGEKREGGVVYNEMKGAYENIERMIYRQIRNVVYKDTVYAYDSGGEPEVIPQLTYEDFVSTYKNYYYPANMKIILYGNIDIKETLGKIEGYVSEAFKREPIHLDSNKNDTVCSMNYEILPNTENAYLIKCFAMGRKLSAKEAQKLELWMTTYLMNSQTYFQNQLMRQGIHVNWLKDDDLPNTVYTLVVPEVPKHLVKQVDYIIDATLLQTREHLKQNVFLENDILKQAKLAFINQENSPNRGIVIADNILDAWAHDKEMNQYYLKKEQIKSLSNLKGNMYTLLFDEAKRYTFTLLPQVEQDKKETETLLSDKQWMELNLKMKEWQKNKVELEPIDIEQLIIEDDTRPIIKHHKDYWEMQTHVNTDLAQSRLYINTSHIKQEKLPYLFLYSYLLEESAREITPFSAIINTNCTAYPLKEEHYWPCFSISIVSPSVEVEHGTLLGEARRQLMSKSDKWYDVKLQEYIQNTKFQSRNNTLNLLRQLCISGEGDRGEYLYQQTYPLYEFCKGIAQDKKSTWIQEIKAIDDVIYHKNGIILSTITPSIKKNKWAKSYETLLNDWEAIPNRKADYKFNRASKECLVKQQGAVDYSFKLLYNKESLDGIDYLCSAYLTKQYLNPKIRINLGAYGAGCMVCDLYSMGIYTYRDPDYRVSQPIVNNSIEFISRVNKDDLNQSKAEALSRVHNQYRLLNTEFEKADISEQLALFGKNRNELLQLQKEIIEAEPQDLVKRIEKYKMMMESAKTVILTQKVKNIDKEVTISYN